MFGAQVVGEGSSISLFRSYNTEQKKNSTDKIMMFDSLRKPNAISFTRTIDCVWLIVNSVPLFVLTYISSTPDIVRKTIQQITTNTQTNDTPNRLRKNNQQFKKPTNNDRMNDDDKEK